MATYKVIQDIEAEDKLIGPLTLKQFIFACVAAVFTFFAFFIASKTSIAAFIPFLPFIIISGVLALPLGKDQSADIWLAAKIRFLLKPRVRVWSQDGVKNLVTITAPKKIEKQLTKDFSQEQVKSRLKALSDIIDSRGWAIKNEALNLSTIPQYSLEDSDRLIDIKEEITKNAPLLDISNADDIMDAQSNTTAQRFDKLVKNSTANKRQAAIEHMKILAEQSTKPIPTPEVSNTTTFDPQLVAPHQDTDKDSFIGSNKSSDATETLLAKQLSQKLKQQKKVSKMISPHHKAIATPNDNVTTPKNPDIVNLATTDFNVATIASLANRKMQSQGGGR